MRAILLLVLSTLLLAGCTTPAAQEEPEPASVDETAPTPAVEPTPTSPTPAPASPSPTHMHTPTQPATPTSPPEAPPALVAWNLSAQARLGWVAAVGAGGAGAPGQGQADAEHCPDATFGVPAGAKRLQVSVGGEPVDPAGPGAGNYAITLTDPAGAVVQMEPLMDNVPESEGGNRVFVAEMPTTGDWKLHAEPIGPVAQQVWTVTLEAAGESEVAPTMILVAAGC